ncbi:VOC family protein [Umezawaea sp. NPDC059074]|uniref:VOC family protein n=1 Tax=Umezawaea sp. NPDC059074 TaxID=3346716 RepID=UPI0036A65D0A
MPAPVVRFGSVVLDCPDTRVLADFYARLLGWPPDAEPTDGWATLTPPDGGVKIEFQHADDWRPPTWPDLEVQQMAHLDFPVDDLEAAHAWAVEVGAEFVRDSGSFRVYLDPAGHPFCLCAC